MTAAKRKSAKPTTFDEYVAPLSADKRAALKKLRKIIRAAAPGAKEVISYSLPAFQLDGRIVMWIGATAKHCAIYGTNSGFEAELSKYDTNKGTIRFQPDKPLPDSLVKRLVKARVARNATKSASAAKAKKRR